MTLAAGCGSAQCREMADSGHIGREGKMGSLADIVGPKKKDNQQSTGLANPASHLIFRKCAKLNILSFWLAGKN